MDMMPPIWPCARRCIHTKKPISSSSGSSSGTQVSRKLLDGVENLMPFLVSSCGVGVGQRRRAGGGDLVAVGERGADVAVGVVVGARLHLVVLDVRDEGAVRDLGARAALRRVEAQDGHQDHADEHPDHPAGPALVAAEAPRGTPLGTRRRRGDLRAHGSQRRTVRRKYPSRPRVQRVAGRASGGAFGGVGRGQRGPPVLEAPAPRHRHAGGVAPAQVVGRGVGLVRPRRRATPCWSRTGRRAWRWRARRSRDGRTGGTCRAP